MSELSLYFATNRRHIGRDRWKPQSYGTEFSSDGSENLRFGKLTLNARASEISKHLKATTGIGQGNGEKLSEYLGKRAKKRRNIKIQAFREKLNSKYSDVNQNQKTAKYGSAALLSELKGIMQKNSDVLIYVHGYSVSWEDAVGSALALQEMLNRQKEKNVAVVLYSWPSDGSKFPFLAYKSDRTDAEGSGGSFGRGLLKLRDFLMKVHQSKFPNCDHNMHIACHSMGCYVLQNALQKLAQFSHRSALPRLFDQLFLCAADVDATALEPGEAMEKLHELAREVTVYFNTGDAALHVSDFTKGNPDRLGTAGAARPALINRKIHQVDCSEIVTGWVEHSYYLNGRVNDDICQSILGLSQHDDDRHRTRNPGSTNAWTLT